MRIGWLLLGIVLAPGCVSKGKYAELETQLTQCERKLDKCQDGPARSGPDTEHQTLLEQLKPLIDRGVLAVSEVDGRSILGMRAEVLFASGSAELSPDGTATVTEIGRVLARRVSAANWQVEGHTDTEPISTAQFPSNWHLGSARSIAVLEVLVTAGLPPDRVSAATFGQHAPETSNATEAGRAQNRRIEIALLPTVATKKLGK